MVQVLNPVGHFLLDQGEVILSGKTSEVNQLGIDFLTIRVVITCDKSHSHGTTFKQNLFELSVDISFSLREHK